MNTLLRHRILPWRRPSRAFSTTACLRTVLPLVTLPPRITPTYAQRPHQNSLLSLQWPSPPRNILLTKKKRTPEITASLIEYANHLHSTYPSTNLILEPSAASEIHSSLPFPIYSYPEGEGPGQLTEKTDLICTLGGDGTILRASSLFSHASSVPPILSFAMGTIGFLGEWKFREYKRAFREVYMSGIGDAYGHINTFSTPTLPPGDHDSAIRGKSLGSHRTVRVLLRNRLRVSITDSSGRPLMDSPSISGDTYALNEVIVHRASSPHLKIIDVYVGGRFLTEAVADGMIISSPTGSTAYSLSSGGSIVHPLVPSLLLTPICPRSLSFRPLVLPANMPITLRLGEKNRGREAEVSIDGKRVSEGIGVGMEVRVVGEEVRTQGGKWEGGVPSIVRGTVGGREEGLGDEEDHWVGGLNALLKFNYPFGDQDNSSS
ncbi:ATP-NAD kinase [Delitschia confertaspora ATCC 74209]|uniref:ATP-NAD kinase n=1 Tax=Delitschia confertaspora ATCC 74209 TaxID=1513339 RepID=A0A9P4MZC8_9PLEO|nr:ATP-NAD kinase [Delitschia confertaspora ATCC 74209]